MVKFFTYDGIKHTIEHHQSAWKNHKVYYSLDFSASDEKQRFEIFRENAEFINNHNNSRKITFVCAHNNFSHISSIEHISKLTTQIKSQNHMKMVITKFKETESPASIDWRYYGYVTRVKDQKLSGTGWAFSVVGAVESANIMMGFPANELSEQQLIDEVVGSNENPGGNTNIAMDHIKSSGLRFNQKYAYTAIEGKCSSLTKKKCFITDYKYLEMKEQVLQQYVGNHGPVSICIDATRKGFIFYSNGVYYEPDFKTPTINHAALCVGYGKLNNMEYWTLKNSWSEHWGQRGYIYTARNKNNFLGIANVALYPEV